MIEDKIVAFKVNMLNSEFLNQLKELEKEGYITQIESVNSKINIGDYRFCIYDGHNHKQTVIEMQLTKITKKKCNYYTFTKGGKTLTFTDTSFGKKVFLTHEEANIAVKE